MQFHYHLSPVHATATFEQKIDELKEQVNAMAYQISEMKNIMSSFLKCSK